MAVRLLGGSDEVQGIAPGPYVRTLWIRFGVGTNNVKQIANTLLVSLSGVKIPQDMDYVVKLDGEHLSVGFGSYASDKKSLRAAADIWKAVPLNIPALLRAIKHIGINNEQLKY